jgi:excisionase family DNA binding protein
MRRVKKFEREFRKTCPPVSTQQAAKLLGLTVAQTRALIRSGELPATRTGRSYLIHPLDIRGLKFRPQK